MSKSRFVSLRLVWLEALIEVDETGSFAAASEALGCSRPMVSNYIRQLESWYGRELVVRADGATLTREGHLLAGISRQALKLLDVWRFRDLVGELEAELEKSLQSDLTVCTGQTSVEADDEIVSAVFTEVDDDEGSVDTKSTEVDERRS